MSAYHRRGGNRGPGGRGGPPTLSLDKVRAPYDFVPLSEKVVYPEWGPVAQQDHPFADGICGRFEIELEAVTPVFVRGEKESSFYRTPDGKPAVPGSSLRGMLRNVVEIATFSRLARVNDHKYGLRDLANKDPKLYRDHMATILNNKLVPLVSAGWMCRNGGDDQGEFPAVLTPCSFAKIEYGLLMELAKQRGSHGFDPGRKQSSPDKYRKWGNASREVDVAVTNLLDQNPPGSPPRIGSVGKVARLDGPTRGTLVFTGQPQNYDPQRHKRPGAGNPKHHDFVFFDDQPQREIAVSREIFREFRFVHSDGGEQHRLTDSANTEWKYWLNEAYLKGGRVPVFFLLEDSPEGGCRLRAIGLAMMFRLPYKTSTKQAVLNAQPLDAKDEEKMDFAELIFGHVPTQRREDSGTEHPGLKGRVSVGLGKLEGEARGLDEVEAVLGTPKASYYPSYVEQSDSGPGRNAKTAGGKPLYKTWMDPDARARGWKRFQVRRDVAAPVLPTRGDGRPMDISKVGTKFRPLAPGSRFKANVRVHNLLPEELGALLWSIELGGDEEALHSLGMAKSLGYGAVKMRVTSPDLVGVDGSPVDPQNCIDSFADYMEARLSDNDGGWRCSRQVYELLTLARPASAQRLPDLRHMLINHSKYRNEYTAAKKEGFALAPAGNDMAWKGEKKRVQALEEERRKRRETEAEAARIAAEQARLDAMTPEELEQLELSKKLEEEEVLLREAVATGTQYDILERWMEESGELESGRREIARRVVTIGKKKRYKVPHIVKWLEE